MKHIIKQIKTHKLLFLLSAGIDLLFFFLLAQLHFRTFLSVADHLKIVSEMLTKNIEQLAIVDVEQAEILKDPAFLLHYHSVLQGILLFLAGSFVIWLVLRGTTWWLAHRMSKTTISLLQYWKRFVLITTIAIILFSMILVLFVSLLNYVTFNILPVITPSITYGLIFILMLFLHYCYSISIAGIQHPKAILHIVCTKKIIPYLSSILWYIIATSIAMFLASTSYTAGIIAVILIMPTITLFRLFLVDCLKKIHQ